MNHDNRAQLNIKHILRHFDRSLLTLSRSGPIAVSLLVTNCVLGKNLAELFSLPLTMNLYGSKDFAIKTTVKVFAKVGFIEKWAKEWNQGKKYG